eukprot:Nitzschia sp. Nitz4//scaffold18_size181773//18013//18870//NITZ4_001895-RA/size181773-processed-gene-0.40-mRNA-1//-1//CDS//3329539951//862//frame0
MSLVTPTFSLGASTQLAFKQSFGFFDDILDDHWKRMQEYHANYFPNHAPNIQEFAGNSSKKSHMWYFGNFHPEFHCAMLQRIPLYLKQDGAKWVCDPHRLRKKQDCLVYSVGSNGENDFERGVHDVIGEHCEIHTFDVISYKHGQSFAKVLEGFSTFHKWGLGNEAQAKADPVRYKTLAQTMALLGHANRTIDIFKIDCEGCEWFTIQDWLQQDLRQILVETHNSPWPSIKDFFFQLHDAGYVMYSKEANMYARGDAMEFSFLKLSLDFFQNHFYKNGQDGSYRH